jgi:predicted outer membrane repeat protein
MQAKTLLNTMMAVILLLCGGVVTGAEVLYVDSSATGANNGTGWANAFVYLQDALAVSSSGDEIWVAEGVYKPDHGGGQTLGDRNASFHLINGVGIYGGFPAGGGTWDDRSVENETVLSGDLDGNDAESYGIKNAWNAGNRQDNSYHVITATRCGPHTIVDTVAVTNGNASETDTHNTRGGGLYNYDNASPTFRRCSFVLNSARNSGGYGGGAVLSAHASSKPTFVECIFTNNSGEYGGAVLNGSGSSPVFTDCLFSDNRGNRSGGAMYNSPASPTIRGCTFRNNSAANDHGGAIYNVNSAPTIQGCRFGGNHCSNHGGAIYNQKSDPTIEDTAFVENQSGDSGGAIMNYNDDGPIVRGCLFHANVAGDDGGAIYFRSPLAGITVESSTFLGNSARSAGGALRIGDRLVNVVNCCFGSNYTRAGGSSGGAIFVHSGKANVFNCTLWNNETNNLGGGIYCGSRTVGVYNSIFWENRDGGGVQMDASAQVFGSKVTMTYCCVQGLEPGSLSDGNISVDPQLMDPLGPDWLPGTLDDDLRLALDSPCIDAGDNERVPAGVITDIFGARRFTDYPHTANTGHGMAPIVDMGSSEICALRWWANEEPAIQPQMVEDWLYLGQPGCWCSPYQCDGDADGKTQGVQKYRVMTNDVAVLVDNWKMKIDDPNLDPCADIDHKSQGVQKFRVFTKDLAVLVKTWKKTDADLGGDCPRAQ